MISWWAAAHSLAAPISLVGSMHSSGCTEPTGLMGLMLRQETDRDSLIAGLAKEYEIEPERVAADMDAFLSDLDSCHLLVH